MAFQVTESVTIARPTKDVFAFVSDLSNEPQYWEGVTRVQLLSGKPGEVGARYARHFIMMGRDTISNLEIVEQVPLKKSVVQNEPDMVNVRGEMSYETVPGGTKLTLLMDVHPTGMARLMQGRIHQMVEAQAKNSLAKLKHVLEAEKAAAKPASKKK